MCKHTVTDHLVTCHEAQRLELEPGPQELHLMDLSPMQSPRALPEVPISTYWLQGDGQGGLLQLRGGALGDGDRRVARARQPPRTSCARGNPEQTSWRRVQGSYTWE